MWLRECDTEKYMDCFSKIWINVPEAVFSCSLCTLNSGEIISLACRKWTAASERTNRVKQWGMDSVSVLEDCLLWIRRVSFRGEETAAHFPSLAKLAKSYPSVHINLRNTPLLPTGNTTSKKRVGLSAEHVNMLIVYCSARLSRR